MTNDDALTEAIRLIQAGKRDAARSVLEPYLLKHPNHIQAWMWEAELFPSDHDKIKVLEDCLRHNPGHKPVLLALTFLKKRSEADRRPAAPVPPAAPISAPPVVKPTPSSSPFYPPFNFTDPAAPASEPRGPAADTPIVQATGSPQPPLPKDEKPQKKSKRMASRTTNVILAIMAFIVFFAALGIYLGGGYYLNGRINQSFAEQNCAVVVQNALFVPIYPKAIFASLFTGYDQYDECRIKLGVEQALAANDWGIAHSLTREYLANHPNGIFAANLSEQEPGLLSTWSGELIASQDYGNGIEKLKLLVEAYPDSPLAQPAPDAILQAYISWAGGLASEQNYSGAEQHLNAALSYFQADPTRSEAVRQELINLYVGWGDMQIQMGDMDNGIKHYEMAGGISPEKVDVELLTARAQLQKAVAIADTGNFDSALAKVREISQAAQAENVISEANVAQEIILAVYSVSASQQAIDQLTSAINLTCEGKRPELQLFGRDAETIRFGLINSFAVLPPGWAAERPGELHYVLCINETEEELETCPYTGNHFLVRVRLIWKVTMYDILNGEKLHTKSFRGSTPGKCPPVAHLIVGSKVSKSYGKRPTVNDIVAWLEDLNLTK